nr:MAG TPA: Major capsid protein [Microviridae sp.]
MKQRNKIMGYSSQKNKVKRNPFDLSHRNMFTAQIGELLPVVCQWVNPNETFKLGYNGLTRTASLQTAAFTRLRENVQFYFVPFYALWRWFPEVYRNMPVGAAGQNITKIAQSSSESTQIGSKLPVFNLSDIKTVLSSLYDTALSAVDEWISSLSDFQKSSATVVDFYNYCESDPKSASYVKWHNKVFYFNGYRLCRVAKLLQMLGYGNYSVIAQYDIAAQAIKYTQLFSNNWVKSAFQDNTLFSLTFSGTEVSSVVNSPDLSVFPLLAYHKICQDHYKLRQWQPFEPYCCNIDYLSPTANLKGLSWFDKDVFTKSPNQTSLFDLEQSNLPIDYLLGVLPTAQYGSEASVPLSSGSGSFDGYTDYLQPSDMGDTPEQAGLISIDDSISVPSSTDTVTALDEGGFSHSSDTSGQSYNIYNPHRHHIQVELGQQISTNLAISALRNMYALQKYKEIQASNDADYVEQVLAHWGIKPQTDKRTSVFISGGDKTISINPQINQNLSGDSEPDIKAIGVSDLSAGAKFTVKDPGLIIGIYRCIPTLDYAQTGIDRNLFKSDVSDFPQPEFDSVGMQTQFRCEVSSPAIAYNEALSPLSASPQPFDYAKTYGYAPRYAELKTSFDRFNGGFLGAFSSWVTGLDAKALSVFNTNYGTSSSNFMYQISELLSVRPSLCYPIFVNQWSGTVNDDKLLIGSVNTVKAVRPFSVYGLPWSK